MKTSLTQKWLRAGLACLLLTAVAAYGQTTNYPFTFNSPAGVTNYWGTQQNGGIASFTNDAPTGGHSTGCLLFKGPAGTSDIGIQTTHGVGITNYSGYTTFQFDVKIEPPQFGTISGFDMWFGFGGGTFEVITNFNVTGTNGGWQHFIFPVALIDGNNSNNLSNFKSLTLQVYDGNYGSTNMVLGLDNFMLTSGSGGGVTNVTPQFTGLSSHTISLGTTNVTLTGTVNTNGQYLPNGTAIKVTINSNTQQTTIDDSTGDFSINYNTTGFATNVYTVTYVSAAATGFNAATNTSTTLTITAQGAVTPQFSGLSSPTTTYGTTNVSLSGTVSTNGQYLPQGTTVTVTADGNAQHTTIDDSRGDFSLGYNTVGIPANTTPYTVKYTSAAASGFNPATNTSTTMTINKRPVVLSGSMVANGTTTVPASDLSVANLVSGDNLTLSGSVQIAGTNVGPENITSFSGLTLGGSSAANYTLTGASGTVTLTSGSSGTNAVPARFFGLHGMGYGSSGYPVPYQPWGLIRTWDHWGNGNINWSGLEPSKGTFTWSAMDATVNAITNANVAILHCFGGGPAWAGGNSPTNILDWDLFITNFVTRYHTKIKYLETWNESAPGEGFYTGTTAMLVKMCNDLESITKSIDPTVTVLMPDATGGSNNIATFYNGYFAAGGTNADAIAFHGYCAEAGQANQITPPEEIIGIVTQLKDAMNAHGQGSKPIFCTEGDWGTEGSGANQPTTNDAVAFMARHYLLMWSLGVSSYAWYDWENNNGSWQWGQMWDPTSGLNAAGVAYQQLYGWMVGATMSQPYAVQGSVYTIGFTRPGGYQSLAVWNTSSSSTFTVPNGYIQYRDLAGNLSSISGTNVTIGIEPILLENMNP